METEATRIERLQRPFSYRTANHGSRGLTSEPVTLSQPVSRNINKEKVEFSEAYIVKGKETKLDLKRNGSTLTSYTYYEGRLRLMDSEGRVINLDRIPIVVENGAYIPMEFHPILKYESKRFLRSEPNGSRIIFGKSSGC